VVRLVRIQRRQRRRGRASRGRPRGGLAFATTQTAAAAGALTWLLIEWWHQRRPTSLGLASGILAGLVAITPAAGHVIPAAALLFGAAGAGLCYAASR